MAIIVRIVSADGTRVATKTLPALPAKLKVPPGAKVEIVDKDTGVSQSLGQYINSHAGETTERGEPTAQKEVVVEQTESWPAAQAWLDTMADMGGGQLNNGQWYNPYSEEEDNEVLGFDKDTLLIGGLVGAGAAIGYFVLTDDDGPTDDIAPAAPSGLDLATEDDTGTNTTDNITSKTEGLTITGNAEAGSTVELLTADGSLATTTAGADGKFTVDISLDAGTHAIIARATDISGNVSAASPVLAIQVVTAGPAAIAAPDLAASDDTGSSNTDNVTSQDNGLVLSGTATGATQVELFDGDTSLGKAQVNNGAYTIEVVLAEGSHAITAVPINVAGVSGSPSPATNITIDATAPSQPSAPDLAAEDDNGASSIDNVTSKTTNLTFSGTAEANSSVVLFDGDDVLARLTVGADGHYSTDLNLDPGDYAIRAQAFDLAGNGSSPSTALELSVVMFG